MCSPRKTALTSRELLRPSRTRQASDVPAIAFEDLITDPVNPWTGSPLHLLTTKEKNELAIVSMSDANGVKANVNNGYKIKDSDWYMVHDSIFDSSNWEHNHPSK